MLKRSVSLGSVIFYILILSACNLAYENPELTAREDNTITPIASVSTATVTSTATSTIIPSSQPATATPQAIAQISTQSEQVSCVVSQANLAVYTVQAGDTLSNIASRTNSTVSQLASLNCLSDTSYILVGQQLIVPNAITVSSAPNSDSQANIPSSSNPSQEQANNSTTSAIDLDHIPSPLTSYQGNIVLSDWNLNVDEKYVIEAGRTFTFTWQMPDDIQFTQVGFVAEPYVDDFIKPRTVFGVDTDLSDGASIQWFAPPNTQTYIFAVGQVAGQTELVVSQIIRLGTEDSNQEFDRHAYGSMVVSPLVEDDAYPLVVIQEGDLITLEWYGARAFGYRLVDTVSFYYEDAEGNISLIGQDADDNDGLTATWQTPSTVSGRVYAEGLFMATQYSLFRYPMTTLDIQIRSSTDG